VDSPFRDPQLRNRIAPTLETERLTLRHVRAEDVGYFADVHADEEISRYIGGAVPREDAWRRAMTGAGFWSVLGIGLWTIERQSDGRAIGHVGFFDFQRGMEPSIAGEPEMGWVLTGEAHGQGYAREASQAALDWFDANFRDVSIPAIISLGNTPSMRLAERLGFERQSDADYRGEPMGYFRRPARKHSAP
jgi:RimJ/RimL family protein N-acetyltransferase